MRFFSFVLFAEYFVFKLVEQPTEFDKYYSAFDYDNVQSNKIQLRVNEIHDEIENCCLL